MPTLESLLLFLLADLALKLAPGPDMALVLSRGVTQGWRPAFSSVLGVGAAGLVQIPAVAFGLAAVFQTSTALYEAVRVLGALYLVYLGARALWRCARAGDAAAPMAAVARDAFWQGFITNLLNPKVFVFLIAFLPQFADSRTGPVWLQILVLGAIMKTNGVLFLGGFAFGAAGLRRWIGRHPLFLRAQEGLLGASMIGLGLYVLFQREPRPGH